MTVQEMQRLIVTAREREPFVSFEVELTDGTRFRVTDKFAVGFRDGGGMAIDSASRPWDFTNETLRAIHYNEPASAASQRRGTMTAEVFDATVTRQLNAYPFEPFVIELVTGQRYEIDHRGGIMHGGGIAGVIAPGKVPIIFEADTVSQIILAPAHAAPKRGE